MRSRSPSATPRACLAALEMVLVAVLLAHTTADSPEQELIEWVRAAGGEVNVDIAAPQGLRGTYAAADMPQGSHLAVIPERLVYVARKQATFNAEAAAVKLLHDMHSDSSTWGPYFAALPEEGLFSKYTFPENYGRMLQSGVDESDFVYSQERLQQYWTAEEDELSGYGVTLSDLVHAAALVDTRALNTPLGEASLVPVVDMANHQTLCPNKLRLDACPHDKEQQCLIWEAGRDYTAGEEVCMSYGGMFNDRSLLQYGFLIEDANPPHLFGADRHDYDVGDPYSNQRFMDELPPPFAAESAEEYVQEADRQRSMLFYMKRADKEAGKEPVDPADPGGKVKALVLRWRELRKAALAAEVSRLRGILEADGKQLLSEAEHEEQLQKRLDDERDMLLDVGTLGEQYVNPDGFDDEDGSAEDEEGDLGDQDDEEDELFVPGQDTEPDTREEL